MQVAGLQINSGFQYLFESGYLEDIGEDWRIILKFIFKTQDGKAEWD
jgi:hypothetical protein